ncbi:glycosyltransferase family 4 protein [uncultured Oceanisphaera sp.]|uniref:glycosyltransferase family 4 protein n=1 Tax=uncultured Oceanisphaera sp. TaxID=353858 RepID=UPI002627A04B|nr:glycosyltransferase family 4 protein [uncultured Oceanisphaera sp.]
MRRNTALWTASPKPCPGILRMWGKCLLIEKTDIILFIVNAPEYFVSHRFHIAKKACDAGFKIHVASSITTEVDQEAVSIIKECGFEYHELPIKRGGENPIHEAYSIVCCYRLIKVLSPVLIHLVTIKPALYGSIAARVAGKNNIVAAIAGLGTIFLAQSFFAKIRKALVVRMLKFGLSGKHSLVIFQNPDDKDFLSEIGVLTPQQARLIRGSGVILDKYPVVPEPKGNPTVVMAARLLKDKGVLEFVNAARLLKQRGLSVEMRLIGSPDPGNPTSVTQQELDQWAAEGAVELLGYRKDIAAQYAAANIICLPSYREGLPKSLVEAAACGRAVVTTDVPGCRDAITPDVTGLLVPVKDAVALADAIQALIEDPELRNKMGLAGRVLAVEAFAIEKIVEQHMDIYQELLEP